MEQAATLNTQPRSSRGAWLSAAMAAKTQSFEHLNVVDRSPAQQLHPKPLTRVEVLVLVVTGCISASEACGLLQLSRSWVYKLIAAYRTGGASSLAPKTASSSAHRAYDQTLKSAVLDIIREEYADFGPTLIAECLEDDHGISLCKETIRKWMIEAKLWLTNRAERRRLHQPRKRMSIFGELILVDGSDHDWFEGRAPRCCLMVMVDDATSSIQHLAFFTSESERAYLQSTFDYIELHGRPVRIVTDRHPGAWCRDSESRYSATLRALSIVHTVAHTAQSKGRVERMNRTLQDRLVKWLRRMRINTIEEANSNLARYIKLYNARHARDAAVDGDAHRDCAKDLLDSAFAEKHSRKLTKQLVLTFRKDQYVIDPSVLSPDRIGSRVTIEVRLDGTTVLIGADGRTLPYSTL